MSRYLWEAPAGDVRSGPLAVRTLGRGHPVLLLHGLGGSNRYWGAGYDRLGEHGQLIVPDLLGFGSSPKPTGGYTAAAHVDALADLLDWLGIAEPVVVGGHSLGGLVALALAALHPGRVAGIVAAGPPIYPDGASARRRIGQLGWLERQVAENRPFAERVCRFTCDHRALMATVGRLARPRLPRPVVADGFQHTWASYSETFAAFILAAPGDAWAASTDVPIRLLAGERDRVLDRPHLEDLARGHPHVALVDVPGADHDLPLARPAMVIDEITTLRDDRRRLEASANG